MMESGRRELWWKEKLKIIILSIPEHLKIEMQMGKVECFFIRPNLCTKEDSNMVNTTLRIKKLYIEQKNINIKDNFWRVIKKVQENCLKIH